MIQQKEILRLIPFSPLYEQAFQLASPQLSFEVDNIETFESILSSPLCPVYPGNDNDIELKEILLKLVKIDNKKISN